MATTTKKKSTTKAKISDICIRRVSNGFIVDVSRGTYEQDNRSCEEIICVSTEATQTVVNDLIEEVRNQ